MQRGILPSILTGAVLFCVALVGCKKENSLGIDNDSVIKTPYSLYAADTNGAIVHTNDGKTFSNLFPPDGYAPTLLLVSGDNLLMMKQNLHLSVNGSQDFNPVYMHANKFPWQTMAYDYPEHNRIYIASTEVGGKAKGISFSSDHGLTWMNDTSWVSDDLLPPSFTISSFSGLANGKLFAYSNEGNVLFIKDGQDGKWTPVTTQGSFPVSHSDYYLTSNDNTLFLVDHQGLGGVWYSSDEGIHWTKFNQGELPSNTRYMCATSPSGGTSLLVGTDSMGVFQTENGSFVDASGGLLKHAASYSFTQKDNFYKNNVVKHYIYLGTSVGIYRSENYGRTWYVVTNGVLNRKFVALY